MRDSQEWLSLFVYRINKEMANPTFSQFIETEEQDFYDGIIVDSIYDMGLEVKYLPTRATEDTIFGENDAIHYDTIYALDMALENKEAFDNGEDMLEKFGLDIRQTFHFTVSITKFTEIVTGTEAAITRPREGDLIFVPMDSSLYEITKVREYEKYFRWGKLFTFELTCELFRYSGQTFETGDTTIDAYNTKFSSEDLGSPYQGSPYDLTSIDPIADNEDFSTEAADILDFDETNPFGDVS